MTTFEKLSAKVNQEDFENNIRISISHNAFKSLLEMLEPIEDVRKEYLLEEMYSKISEVEKFNRNKINATLKATEIRVEKAKKRIVDTIEHLKRNDLKVNQSSIAKHSKCSVNTVKQYKYLFE